MKSNFNTFGVIFFIKKYKAKNGKAPIYARITVDSRRTDFSVKKSIDPRLWNGIKGMAKGSNPETIKSNQYLESIRSKIVTLYQETIIKNETPTAEDLKNKYLGIEKIDHTLSMIFPYHYEISIDSLSEGTLKNYRTTKGYLFEFLKKKYKKTDIQLTKIDYKFLVDFQIFLKRRKPKDHQRLLSNNGIMKHMERFRKIMRLAYKIGWTKENPFKLFDFHYKKKERGYLTYEELKK